MHKSIKILSKPITTNEQTFISFVSRYVHILMQIRFHNNLRGQKYKFLVNDMIYIVFEYADEYHFNL